MAVLKSKKRTGSIYCEMYSSKRVPPQKVCHWVAYIFFIDTVEKIKETVSITVQASCIVPTIYTCNMYAHCTLHATD